MRYCGKNGRAGHPTYDSIICRTIIACRIPKDRDTHLAYVKVIAFLRKQRLRERASNLRYTYVICLVTLLNVAAYWHFY
jgi:hypothetical protein